MRTSVPLPPAAGQPHVLASTRAARLTIDASGSVVATLLVAVTVPQDELRAYFSGRIIGRVDVCVHQPLSSSRCERCDVPHWPADQCFASFGARLDVLIASRSLREQTIDIATLR